MHVVSDVGSKEGEVVESDAVQTDGGVVIGLDLMLAHAFLAEYQRGFVDGAE